MSLTPDDIAEFTTYPWWPHEARINAGHAGHDREIVVVIDTPNDAIPELVADALRATLPGWLIENRSTRLEVHPTGRFAGGFAREHVDQTAAALDAIGLQVTDVDVAG